MAEPRDTQSDRYDKILTNLKKINEENSRVFLQAKAKANTEEISALTHVLDRLKLQEEVGALYILLPKIKKLLTRLNREESDRKQSNKRIEKNRIRKEELEILLRYTEDAIDLLTYEHPSIYLAKRIRINIQKTLNFYDRGQPISFFLNRWVDFYHAKSDPLKVVIGLSISTPVFLFLFSLAIYYLSIGQTQLDLQIAKTQQRLGLIRQTYQENPQDRSQESIIVGSQVQDKIQSEIQKSLNNPDLNPESLSLKRTILVEEAERKRELTRLEEINKDYSLLFFLILVSSSGALGSIISLFSRIQDFEEKEYADPLILLLTGALKPLIGAVFGLLLFAILKSGILAVQINPTRDQHKSDELFLCSLAFVIGFSERLAKDVIKRTENTLLGSVEQRSTLPMRSENRQDEGRDN